MPSQYTLESLPQALDQRVQLREVPATKKAVIMFSGFYSEEKVKEKTAELERWIQEKNLQAIGLPNFARYNPPWTLPFLRRNEVMIEVRDR
jgi:DNA gyrase inhibitor GyrI